jgi:hypothetical protein
MAGEDTGNPVEQDDLEELVEETGDETEDDEETGEEEDPAAVKGERDKLRTTLAKIKAERTALRKKLAEKNGDKPDEAEDEAVKADTRVKRLAGVAALTAEGLSKAQAKVAVRLLDLSEVEVDEDGDADLEDAVEELKELFPGLFGKADTSNGRPTPPRKVTTADRGGRSGGPVRDRTSLDLLKAAGYR